MKYVLQLAVFTLLLSGCSGDGSAPAPAGEGPRAVLVAPPGATVVTINGEAITAPMLEVFARGRGLDPGNPAGREKALESLIENVLLAQDAHARGIAARPEVQAEVALVAIQQLAGRNLAELRAATPVDEAAVRAYYDQEAVRTGGIELHLQHVLFADAAAAQSALERARAPGADFDALMAEYAAGSAKQARDLGWANLTQLPVELGQAAQGVADGQVGPQPVQTSFGWHVFKRVASRPYTPPPFEQVADGARKQLVERALAEQVQKLRASAKIEVPESSASSQ